MCQVENELKLFLLLSLDSCLLLWGVGGGVGEEGWRFPAVMANLFLGKIGTFGRNFMSILGMTFRHIFLQFQILSLFIQSFCQDSEVEGGILTNK